MPRRLFSAAVPLLLVVLICCSYGAVHAEGNKPKGAQLPQSVELFVPSKTQVQANDGAGGETRASFRSPSLVRAGGVLVAFAEGHRPHNGAGTNQPVVGRTSADIVAGYINAAEGWASIVAETGKGSWRAHTVFNRVAEANGVGRAFYPTAVAKGNKVFLIVGSYEARQSNTAGNLDKVDRRLDLLVGEASEGGLIQWAPPTSLSSLIGQAAEQSGTRDFCGAGGSGIVMDNGTLVFPLLARRSEGGWVSTIVYSADDGKTWVLPSGASPSGCAESLLAEWEAGQLLMVAVCDTRRRVLESRDMGATWTEALGTLSNVWVDPAGDASELIRRVTSLTTATIAGKKVMLCTQERRPSGVQNATALYLWVTDGNLTFHAGPVSGCSDGAGTCTNALLHSNDELHLVQEKGSDAAKSILLTPLTKELKRVTSVVEAWARLERGRGDSSLRENVSRVLFLPLLVLWGLVALS
ncbi:group II trans-sialidase superfamily [Trypanosoma conorhini]|uniref:Group II trans-sialidase superfamily n=1 Tax=Trypanosoma conorhini TaxID=83891 RepID=A0A3R7L9E2_9TRYP|nr:group II trans-sialidase superfamily [Trypanosoma conorhini]RNF23763.1 group II trans-sialidase superfamily [Trypanosoma conorhini]